MFLAKADRLAEQRHQVAVYGNPAGAVEVAEVQLGIAHQSPQRLAVPDANRDGAFVPGFSRDRLVPQCQAHLRGRQATRNVFRYPAIQRTWRIPARR